MGVNIGQDRDNNLNDYVLINDSNDCGLKLFYDSKEKDKSLM